MQCNAMNSFYGTKTFCIIFITDATTVLHKKIEKGSIFLLCYSEPDQSIAVLQNIAVTAAAVCCNALWNAGK